MSQHVFMTQHGDEPIKVVLGYDRPLKGFFLTVERLQPKTPADRVVFDIYGQPSAFDYTLDDLAAKLGELQINVPAQMFDEVYLESILGRYPAHRDLRGLRPLRSDLPVGLVFNSAS